jgi:glycosyltransferase involved in cell wall biosynthesis
MSLPKVLIINQPFNNNTGGGITLTNLFNGWDKNKIAVVCHNFLLENVSTNRCNKYYQLGYKEHKYIFPFNLVKRKHYSGALNFDGKEIKTPNIHKSKMRIKIVMDYFFPIVKFLGIDNGISRVVLSNELCQWLDDFNPDVIYAQSTSKEGLEFILLVHAYLKIPLVFHMMDDWLAVGGNGLFNSRNIKRNEREFIKLVNAADVLMSISEEMGTEYKRRYGKTHITFHNPIDLDFWGKYQRINYDLPPSPVILYAGRLGLGIDTSLQLIAKAIQLLNKKLNLHLKFVLQTKEAPAWIADYNCVEQTRFVAYDELPRVFSAADLLILPYDFSSESIKYIGYSMPTKATEYMASGTPIIVFSPEETAIVNYARKYDWAKVITENNIDTLCEGIAALIQNETTRQQIAQNAINVAKKNHGSVQVTQHFQEVIDSVINKAGNNI